MGEPITLELPEEVTGHAREVVQRTGRQLADVLTEWLTRGAASEDTARLYPGTDYHLYTPYGNERAVQGLLDALHAEEPAASMDEPPR